VRHGYQGRNRTVTSAILVQHPPLDAEHVLNAAWLQYELIGVYAPIWTTGASGTSGTARKYSNVSNRTGLDCAVRCRMTSDGAAPDRFAGSYG
jgi:hypothetical protein